MRAQYEPATMSSPVKRILCFLGATLVLCCVTGWVLFFSGWLDYKAKDYDARLTRIAKTAKIAIGALERFHHDHSVYPADTAALAPYLSSTRPTPNAPEIAGWYYTRKADGSGYTLARKLSWDPCLLYEFDGAQAHWVFSPGDGGPDKTILLKP
jgi:hypothetical protein